MNTFEELTEQKNEIISSLQCLPQRVKLPVDESILDLQEEYIAEEIKRDITHIQEFWQFIAEYHDRFVIALVGMVNAGKSALGNHYAHRGESGFFEETPIRQTSKASQIELEQRQLLIDLPGLGSVLSDEDDRLVKGITRRANLLLIVIGVNQPITDHLYQFLQSDEVLKKSNAQRIVIVINKIDILDSYPEAHKRKPLEKYIDFLKNGDREKGFEGISRLFDYDIPVLTFSVFHARNGIDQWREVFLRHAIADALEGSSHSSLIRAKQELINICQNIVL